MTSCLFCATLCPPEFAFVDEQIRKFKSENDTKNSTSSPLSFKREDPVIADQLKVVFILRNILKIEKDKLCQFLGSSGNYLHPEDWIRVCLSCENIVGMFYQTVKDISKLQKKLEGFSSELKERMQKSKFKEEKGPTRRLWKEIRDEVLSEIETEDLSKEDNSITIFPSSSESEYGSEEDEDSQENNQYDDDDDEDYVPNSKRRKATHELVSIAKTKALSTPTRVASRKGIKLIGKSEVVNLNSEKIAVKKEVNLVEEIEEFPENEVGTSGPSSSMSSLFLNPENDELSPDTIQTENDLWNSVEPHPTSEDGAESSDKTIIRILDDSDPLCSKFYRGNMRRYGCRICTAEENSLKMLLVHLKLHEEGSGGIPCPECGWFVKPDRLQHHNGHHHKHLRRRPPRNLPTLYYFKCPECNALVTHIDRYREHEEMHEKGEGVICPEEGCGWLVKVLYNHRDRWHPKDGTKRYKLKHDRKIKVMEKRSERLNKPKEKRGKKKKAKKVEVGSGTDHVVRAILS